MEARLSLPAFQAERFSHPIFEPVRDLAHRLAASPGWPGPEQLNRLRPAAPRTASGHPVRFVPPVADGRNYELRIHARGEVCTRPDNWHDLFNALAWLAFPRTKAALNARHAAQLPHEGAQRSRLRDLLTIFDEGGAIVLCANPALEALARAHEWRGLFWDRRAALAGQLCVLVAGHAVLEQALAPWPGITCKAVFVAAPEALLAAPLASRLAFADAAAAHWIEDLDAGATPARLAPLPVFGLPGWHPESAQAGFYDDTRYFRPFRRATGAGGVKLRRESARQPLSSASRAAAEESPGSEERDAG